MEKEGDDGKRESSLVAMSHRSTPSSPDGNADGSDKCTNNQPEDTVIDMEEGVDIHGYDDSLYHHDYSFDVPHTNPVSVDTVNPLDDHILGGTKRPTETTDDSVGIKRYKTEDEGQKNTTLSTNKQWDAMFDRLVAFKERNGVRPVRGAHNLCDSKKKKCRLTFSILFFFLFSFPPRSTVSSPNDMQKTQNLVLG